jgi:hypothetical protein
MSLCPRNAACREHAPVTILGRNRPSVRLGAGLAWARERPARSELIRHDSEIVKWKIMIREIASRAGGLPLAEIDRDRSRGPAARV